MFIFLAYWCDSALGVHHGLINYKKNTKAKCRLYWCLIEFIHWRYVGNLDPTL
jgi:hypothetical protein